MARSITHSFPVATSTGRELIFSRVGPILVPVGVAILAGLLLATQTPLTVICVAAAALLIPFLRVPWLPYVLTAGCVATVAFYAGWPEVFGIKVPEVVLALALLATGVHLSRTKRQARSMQGLLVGAFLLTMAAGVYVGLQHGATMDGAVRGVRPMVFYASFWPALVALSDPQWRSRVMRIAAVGAAVVVGLQLGQIRLGAEQPLFAFTSSVQDQVLTSEADGFLRVRPPGLTLIYVMTIFATAYLLWGPRRHRLRASAVFGVGALGVLLSLNRNMLLGIVLGLTVAALLVPRRNRVLITALVCCSLAIPSLSLLRSQARTGSSEAVIQRVLSIGDISELQAGTLSDRAYENRLALRVLRRDPVTGIGWGTSYGATITEYRDGRVVTEPRGFIHQQYLAVWMRMGLAGLVALLILLGVTLASAARWSRKRAWDDQSWLGPAILASLSAFIASSSVGTYLTNPESIVVLTGILALACALAREMSAGETEAIP